MKILIYSLLLIAVLTGCSHKSKDNTWSAKIEEICPGAEIVEVEQKEGYSEIEYLCNGEKFEVGLDENFEIIYTEKRAEIPGDVLEKIMKKLDKAYQGWKIDEWHIVEIKDTASIKVELLRNGIEQNVYFSLDGKYFRPLNVAGSDKWTSEKLALEFQNKELPYNFLLPDKIFDLPENLREVSGIEMITENEIFMVQDELGALFKYDLEKETVVEMLRFTDEGDFEDLALSNETAYVLRSDGAVFTFNYKKFDGKAEAISVPVQSTNIEGLFFDPTKNQLLMASKNEPVNGAADERPIYQLATDELNHPEISFFVNNNQINNLFSEKYPGLIAPGNEVELNPSAIAVHPLTDEIYVLSASDRLLAIFSNKQLVEIIPLPSDMYHKPEGLTFSQSGDLFISSEGIKNGYVNGQIFYFQTKP